MAVVKPWTDCPECPKCGLPCGILDRDGCVALYLQLHCSACGHEWEGSAEERAQARAADAAWEAEQARVDAEEREGQQRAKDAERLAELHEMKRKGLAT